MTEPVTVIFPMAGQGARFGYRFKPFLQIDERPFIAAAVEPFLPHVDAIARFLFVYLAQQEADHSVEQRLRDMLPDLDQTSIILPEATPGPSVTLRQALGRTDVSGPIIVCDCDHALDVGPIFAVAADPTVACILPTWSLSGERIESWGVAGIDDDGQVVAVGEKRMPGLGSRFRGIIGCYYFRDVAEVVRIIDAEPDLVYISDIIQRMLANGQTIVSVDISDACFFGDPERLASATANTSSINSP